MKSSFNRTLSILVVITILTLSVTFALAHDPSVTQYPGFSHIHFKGKITAPDGSVPRLPQGAAVSAKSSELFKFISPECHLDQNPVTSPINPNTGEYELIFYFKADSEKCRNDVAVRPAVPSAIKFLNAPGYEFKFKQKTN